MLIRQITPDQLPKVRKKLIHFLSIHGDKRITKKGIQWLQHLETEKLSVAGNCILISMEENKLTGLLVVSDYGRHESYIAVHTDFRQQQVAVSLIQQLLKSMDRAYGRVALDNIPSLKMCLSIGMVGFKVVTGPTGKPTLWLGYGNWTKEDVE